MQKLVNTKQCIFIDSRGSILFPNTEKEKERKAKHAEAGVEISNHECKHISFTSVCASKYMCFETNDSQQTIAGLQC